MTDKIVGIVEEVIDKGKASGSGLRIDGKKYGIFDPNESGLAKIEEGDNVSFRFSVKPGAGGITYKNIQGKVTKVNSGASSSSGGSGGGNKYRKNGEAGGFPIHAEAYERALDRRVAVTVAAAALGQGAGFNEVIAYARNLEAYTTGDIDAVALATRDEEIFDEGAEE